MYIRKKDIPQASSSTARKLMQAILRRDTVIEKSIRSRLHRLGFRYRVDERPLPSLNRRADLVFRRDKVALFVDGCFWHGWR